jgi:Uma2 family endonuclease
MKRTERAPRAFAKEASMSDVPRASSAEVPPRIEILSADDWLALPDALKRHELIMGHLTLAPSPDLRYDLIVADLAQAIGRITALTARGGTILSQTGFVVSAPGEDETVLIPALAYISAERLSHVPQATPAPMRAHANVLMRVAPDLVIEIASPSQREPEIIERMLLWRSAGVRLIWVVWPARRQVTVWTPDSAGTPEAAGTLRRTLSAHETLDGGETVPGFAYIVAHLFL